VLLDPPDHRQFLAMVRRPNLDALTVTAFSRQLSTTCRKCTICPYCGAINGVVKKIGPMRIAHEQFRGRNKTKVPANAAGERGVGGHVAFKESFTEASFESNDLETHLDKAVDDLNPLRVLTLFKNVPAVDCELLGLDPTSGRPEEFLWQYISVPPVCIRPSVQQEAAT
jgi:DNA-directed RNA polymerase III subunit RPC1